MGIKCLTLTDWQAQLTTLAIPPDLTRRSSTFASNVDHLLQHRSYVDRLHSPYDRPCRVRCGKAGQLYHCIASLPVSVAPTHHNPA